MTRPRIGIIVGLFIVVGASGWLHGASQEPAPVTAATAAGTKVFDVASVRPNRSGTIQSSTNRTPTGVRIVNQTLRPIIQLAYGIQQPSRIAGMPDWVNVERFDLDARGTINGLDDFRAMMQALLADRFNLAAHTEQRSIPIYTLVLARRDGKLGPSLKPSTRNCPPAGVVGRGGPPPAEAERAATADCGLRPGGPGEINLGAVPISALVAFLSLSQQRPVIDQTGLTGHYDIHLLFAPDPIPGRPADEATAGRASLFTAIQEQLGVKLEAGNQLQEVLVIDRVSRPNEN